MCDLRNVFNRTVLLLKRDGLWPADGTGMSVDYALANTVWLLKKPEEYDANFHIDFGGSEGIYIDLTLSLRYAGEEKESYHKFGTIKTLADSREAYAMYAALGANFTFYARRELHEFVEGLFPAYSMKYYIYSMDDPDLGTPLKTLDADEVRNNLECYVANYRVIHEGKFSLCSWTNDKKVCEYLRDKAFVENVYRFGTTDIIALERTDNETGRARYASYIFDGKNNSFVPCNLHEYNLYESADKEGCCHE